MAGHDLAPAAPRAAPSQGPALCLSGGGYRASSVEAALTSGLLAVAHALRPGAEASPTLKGTGLYGRFASVASVSGGTWFAAELIYSERFVLLVERMAAAPAQAAALHREEWTEPLLAVAGDTINSNLVNGLTKILQSVGLGFVSNQILLLGYMWKTGLTWTNNVKLILEATGGLDESVTLGSPVMPWAEGKAWLVAHTLFTPSADSERPVYLVDKPDPWKYVTQRVAGSPGASATTPACYSYVLGSAKASAPVPYVSASALPPDAQWVSQGILRSWCPCWSFKLTASARVGDFSTNEQGAADLPVVSCAAASSAFAAAAVVTDKAANFAFEVWGADFAVWQGAGPAGESFSRASALVSDVAHKGDVSQKVVDRLADGEVRCVADGAYSDNTAVGFAVGAGAVEVVAYLNLDASNIPAKDALKELFVGDKKIFEQTYEWLTEEYGRFPKLTIRDGAKYLTAISVGTLQVKTIENILWGTRDGVQVTLHILGVASTVDVGTLTDFYDFDVLAQEILETVIAEENKDLVQNTVMPWFLAP